MFPQMLKQPSPNRDECLNTASKQWANHSGIPDPGIAAGRGGAGGSTLAVSTSLQNQTRIKCDRAGTEAQRHQLVCRQGRELVPGPAGSDRRWDLHASSSSSSHSPKHNRKSAAFNREVFKIADRRSVMLVILGRFRTKMASTTFTLALLTSAIYIIYI